MHRIESDQILNQGIQQKINRFCSNKTIEDIIETVDWVKNNWDIDVTLDSDIIKGYLRDWSNIEGYAIGLCRP